MTEKITLKWGTLKGWSFNEDNETAMKLLEEYCEIGSSISAMTQKDTPRQKEIICELIDIAEEVTNDWSGDDWSDNKQAAKDYVLNYGK